MDKNRAGQQIHFSAWTADGKKKSGDAANITATISLDGGSYANLGGTPASNPTEIGSTGDYYFEPSKAESNADDIRVEITSTTAGVEFDPIHIRTSKQEAILGLLVPPITHSGSYESNDDLEIGIGCEKTFTWDGGEDVAGDQVVMKIFKKNHNVMATITTTESLGTTVSITMPDTQSALCEEGAHHYYVKNNTKNKLVSMGLMECLYLP